MQEDYNSSHTGQQIDNAVDSVITANSNGGIQSKNIVDSGGYFSTDTVEGALQALGAAKLNPTNKTSAMTQAVGKDSNGMLWTEPSGGGGGSVAPDAFIDLDRYGIVEGDIPHKSPYSADEWEQAHNNQEGIRNALVEMANEGITNISLPMGTYVICYQNPTGAAWQYNTGWEIVIPSNVTFNLNGSTIKVIYDSENKNPYDASTNTVYTLNGNAFVFSKSYDAHLINGVILGDRYERSFTISSEKNEEQTYGVYVKEGSARCSIENLSISGFMGDAVSGNASHNPDLGSSVSNPKTFTNGEIGTNGVESQSAKPTTFISDYINISGVIQNTNQIVLRTNIGYQYRFQSDYEFRMFFYNTDKTFISYADYYQCDNIPVPHGTAYVRIMLVNESLSGQTSVDITYQLSPPSSEYFTAYNCKFYNNNRGGMSNLPHDCTIDSCELYENGTAGTEGFPVFGDTTRYAINCEDTVSRKLSVINCNIHNGFNLFLLSVKNLYIANNMIYDFSGGVDIVSSEKAVVSGNFFRNTGSVHASKAVTDVIVTNNHFENCSLNQESSLGKLYYIDNFYESNKVDIVLPKSSVSKFLSVKEQLKSIDEYFASRISGTFVDTTFDFINEQYSTNFINVDMGESSNGNVINLPSDRELIPTNVVGTKVSGGRIRNRGTNVNWRLKDSQINLSQRVGLYSYMTNNEQYITLDGCKINVDHDFSADILFEETNNAGNTGSYSVNYVFDSCMIEVDNDSVAAFIRSDPGIRGGTTIIHNSYEFRNCIFVNKGNAAISIINFAGDYVPDTSNYSLTFVDNEIVGLWNLPPALDNSVVRFLNKYNPVEKTSAMTQPVGVDSDGKLYTEPGGGGGGGTTDHTQLTNRDAANQHPISAITGLQGALDSKATEAYVNNAITTAIGNIDNLIGSGVIV